MKKPEPEVGMVIKYDFLWSHESKRGQEDGSKDRPCVVVTAVTRDDDGIHEVMVAPITHSPPEGDSKPVEVPHRVAKHLGLDDDRMYVVTHEGNSLDWDDPGFVPAIPKKEWIYGRVPMALYDQIIGTMRELYVAKKTKIVNRTQPVKK